MNEIRFAKIVVYALVIRALNVITFLSLVFLDYSGRRINIACDVLNVLHLYNSDLQREPKLEKMNRKILDRIKGRDDGAKARRPYIWKAPQDDERTKVFY